MSLIITPEGFLLDDRKQLILSCPKQPDCWCTVDCALCVLGSERSFGEPSETLTFYCGCQPVRKLLANPYTPPEVLQRSQQGPDEEPEKGDDNEVPEG